MGRVWSIGFLLLVSLAACTPKGDDGFVETRHGTPLPTTSSPELAVVDSLMWLQPDSALACLIPYFDTCCRDAMIASPVTTDGDFIETHAIETHAMRLYNRHYAHLLLAELLYKNDYAQTNRAELLDAVGYFDSLMADTRGVSVQGSRRRDARRASAKNTAFLDARAHYSNGVGYYEHDSVVDACKEYLKALEMMEDHFEEEDLVGKKAKFMALTYTRLTDLFSDRYLHEQAIYFGKRSLHYYNKYEASPVHIVWILNKIGSHYDILNNYDSACYFYNQGLQFLSDTNNSLSRGIASHMAFIEYEMGIPPTTSLIRLHALLAQAENDQEYASRCLTIGEIYYHEHQLDSAYYYLDIVYEQTQSAGAKKQAAEWLVEICKMQGKNDEMINYAEFLVPFANLEENKSGIKSQITELYNVFSQNKLERQHHKEIRNRRKLSVMAYSGLLLVTILIVILYHYNKRRKQHLEDQINEEKRAHIIEKKSLSSRLKKSNASLRELQDQIKKQNSNSSKNPEAQAATFMEEPICRLILERVREGQFKSQMNCTIYKDYALSKEQLVSLHDAANRHYDHFTERLVQAYPDLTKNDMDYCCLYLLGLTDADIAALMQRAYSTVSDRSRKLKTVFRSTNPLPITLHHMVEKEITV